MSPVPQISFDTYAPKVAIITGGAQGIGYATTHRLADDSFDVAVNDIHAKQKELDIVVEEVRQKGRRAIAVPGDVSSESDVVALVDNTPYDLGSVDIMVANAGVFFVSGFLELPVERFNNVFDVNIRGVFLCLKHATLQMVKQGRGGRLIAASSATGKQGLGNVSAYSASKFAVRGLIQSASIDLRKYGITANAYAPGIMHTPMTNEVIGEEAAGKATVSVRQIAKAEVIAGLVSYLAKPESYFVNGQTITIDGGSYHFD